LYFKTLQPLEFVDLENVQDEETREEETGVKLKKIDGEDVYPTKEQAIEKAKEMGCEGYHEHEENGMTWYMPCKDHSEAQDLSEDDFRDNIAQELIDLGEDEEELLNDFELVDESQVDYEFDDEMDELIENANEQINLASTGSAKPYRESKQDGKTPASKLLGYTFLVRYKYAPERVKRTSREFCKKMVSAKKVYRKEDIKAMDQRAVNAGFGKGGSDTYSIWLYKGGARCHHYWSRRTYLRKDGNKSLGKKLYDSEAKRRGFIAPKNAKKVAIKPKDMPYSGYTAAYAKKIGISR
jgi:hypothetical protein